MTSPEFNPTRSFNVTPSDRAISAASVSVSFWMSSAVEHARTAWSSSAIGAPNTAMMPVAGELVDGAAVALHHGRGTLDQLLS